MDAMKPTPLCERCNAAERKIGRNKRRERYCKACRRVVLREMEESGYLTRAPKGFAPRTNAPTWMGEDEGGNSFDNAVRATEGGS